MIKLVARWLAESFLLSRAKVLWEKNRRDWFMPMTKPDKALVGTYLVLRDFGMGVFPPVTSSQEAAYDGERFCRDRLPGVTRARYEEDGLKKPFFLEGGEKLFASFAQLILALRKCGVKHGDTVIELGCGFGWTAEFLALMGLKVVATTLAPEDVNVAQRRVRSFEAKKVNGSLRFLAIPMESADQLIGETQPANLVLVMEALHHAYDWRAVVKSAFRCVKPGGWFVIWNEPNIVHTAVSYRVAMLSGTKEEGLNPHTVMNELRSAGFTHVRWLSSRWHWGVRPFSIAARR